MLSALSWDTSTKSSAWAESQCSTSCACNRGWFALTRSTVSPPCSTICSAMAFWHPIASKVTIAPRSASSRSSCGTAVISLEPSWVWSWASTSRLRVAQQIPLRGRAAADGDAGVASPPPSPSRAGGGALRPDPGRSPPGGVPRPSVDRCARAPGPPAHRGRAPAIGDRRPRAGRVQDPIITPLGGDATNPRAPVEGLPPPRARPPRRSPLLCWRFGASTIPSSRRSPPPGRRAGSRRDPTRWPPPHEVAHRGSSSLSTGPRL